MADSSAFYNDLPILESFFEASKAENYHAMPDDWYVGVTDIVDSTRATDRGKYKTVNILGASPIIGLLNTLDEHSVPYVFGGDGVVICFPPSLIANARDVLAASRQIGREEYGLDLRAAIIPVSYITDRGYEVKVARYRVSDAYVQSVFSGGGLTFAEELLKDQSMDKFQIPISGSGQAVSFEGLECRWQKVRPGNNKKVITLLVKHNPERPNSDDIYRQTLQKMRDIFGFDDKTNPIAISNLKLSHSISGLMGEVRLRTFGKNGFQRFVYLLKVQFFNVIGRMLMRFNIKTSTTDWSRYKNDLAINTDHRKFDDMLRVVISGSEQQIEQLQRFLEEQYEASVLAYGISITDSATITCMVNQYQHDHIHFVDGSKGGYVKASKGLKHRLKKLEKRS